MDPNRRNAPPRAAPPRGGIGTAAARMNLPARQPRPVGTANIPIALDTGGPNSVFNQQRLQGQGALPTVGMAGGGGMNAARAGGPTPLPLRKPTVPVNPQGINGSSSSLPSMSSSSTFRPVAVPANARTKTGFSDSDSDVEKGPDAKKALRRNPYVKFVLMQEKIPRVHNLLASIFILFTFGGFMVAIGSFTSGAREQPDANVEIPVTPSGDRKIRLTRANTAALASGFLFVLAGSIGTLWLALRWCKNWVWVLNRLYMPLLINGVAGGIAMIVAVYTQQAGEWSTQAVVVGLVDAGVTAIAAIMFSLNNCWLMNWMKENQQSDDSDDLYYYGSKKKGRKGRKGRIWSRVVKFKRKKKVPGSAV